MTQCRGVREKGFNVTADEMSEPACSKGRPPNRSLQGPGTHEVLGQPSLVLHSAQCARVLKRTRAAPELNR